MIELIMYLTIFMLAIFVGYEIIHKIPPTLHTPLMSGTNAISGIVIVGAIIAASTDNQVVSTYLGYIAIIFASANVVGGYLVTRRMLAMFRKKDKK